MSKISADSEVSEHIEDQNQGATNEDTNSIQNSELQEQTNTNQQTLNAVKTASDSEHSEVQQLPRHNIYEDAEDDIGLNNTKPIENRSSQSSDHSQYQRKSIAPIHFNKQQKQTYNFKLTTNAVKNEQIFDFSEKFVSDQKEESYRPNVLVAGYGYGQKAPKQKKSFLGGLPKPLQKQ